jgi:hypothetical protein
MSVKLYQLLNPRFQEVLAEATKAKISAKGAWNIKKVLNQTVKELQDYEAARKDLFNKYGNKKEDGSVETDAAGEVQFTDENRTEFQKQLLELVNVDIDLHTMSIEQLEGFNASAEDFAVLGDLITD